MRNKNWLRYGLASAVVASGALGAILVACGDDDSGVTANPDGGKTDGPGQTDTGGGSDTGTGTDGGDASKTPEPAKIIVVHGATSYGDHTDALGLVRVCYATKTSTDPDFTLSPLAPLPHSKDTDSQLPWPGIPIGAGGPFPSTGLPLEGISIRPYVISAQALAERGITGTTGAAATARCNRLLTSGFVPDGGFPGDAAATALAENQDFWKLADIPAGTFKNEKTYVLTITGCTSDGTATAGFCGNAVGQANTPYVPTAQAGVGNLQVAVLEIDATSTIATDEMGVQVVHLSPQYNTLRVGTAGVGVRPFSPVFGSPTSAIADASYDAASNVRVLGPDASAEIPFTGAGTVTALAKLKGIVTASGYFAANEDDPATSGPFIPIPLNNNQLNPDAGVPVTIQYLSEGKTVPSATPAYNNGKAYTFVLVGDPSGSGLKKVHFLAFPNQFTPPPAN
jgi:hypothetical protein